MQPTVLCYPQCGTCQKAEKWLKTNGITYIYRPIKEENPSKTELSEWIKKAVCLSVNFQYKRFALQRAKHERQSKNFD